MSYVVTYLITTLSSCTFFLQITATFYLFQAGYPSKIFGLNNQGQEGQRGPGGGGGGQGKSGDEENSRDSSNGDPQGQNKKRGRYSESEDPAGHHMVKKVGLFYAFSINRSTLYLVFQNFDFEP